MSTNELIISISVIHGIVLVIVSLVDYLKTAALIRMWEAQSSNNDEEL